jgi:aminopeptidase N
MLAHGEGLRAASGTFVHAITQASAEAGAAATRTAAEQTKMLEGLSQGYARLREDAAAIGADMRGAIKEAGDGLRASLTEMATELQRTSGENVKGIGQHIQRVADEEFRRIAASLDAQVKQLDEAMTRELERALTALGSQLVSLTGKFVEDYRVLTGSVQEAVRAMRREAA